MQVNLGVCQENPSTVAGTIRIMEQLQQYVPTHEEQIFQLLCFGDGLSCERHNDAHMARSNGESVLQITGIATPGPGISQAYVLLCR